MAASIASKTSFASLTILIMRKMSIGNLIRAGRDRLGMTEQRFADALGISRGAVQHWEKNKTAPSRKRQNSVAKLIGVSVGELMAGIANSYPEAAPRNLVVNDGKGSYDADPFTEARELLSQMNLTGRAEAMEYLRYLAKRHPAGFSSSAAHGPGDTLPPRSKAA